MTTLEPLVLEPGTKPEAFLEANGQRAEFGLPQFVSAEGTFYLVLPAFYPPRKSPDGTGAGFLLVHCDGRALDCVQLISTNRNAELGHYFLPKPADDGSQLALVDNVPFGASYKLHQWRQPTRELSVSTALYLRVRRDRFEVLEVK